MTADYTSLKGNLLLPIIGILSMASFAPVGAWTVLFLGNFGPFPTISTPEAKLSSTAVLVNTGLVLLFALQHSVMARPSFKNWLARWVPPPVERSVYILASNAALAVLMLFWHPVGPIIWDLRGTGVAPVLMLIYGLGWMVMGYASSLLGSFDLMGLRQLMCAYQGKPYSNGSFRTPGLYAYVRHPIYVGWLMIFWAAPLMSAAHLMFAILSTLYILIAIRFEERDLVTNLGDDYSDYQTRVPMLIPRAKKRR